MDKQKAIEELQAQLKKIARLKEMSCDNQDFKKWRRDTKVLLANMFGGDNKSHVGEFAAIEYSPRVWSLTQDNTARCQGSYRKGLETSEAVLESMIKEIEEWGFDQAKEPLFDATAIIENLCSRFHLVVRQLKSRHDNRGTLVVEDEYDVQDLLHALLTLHFDDIRPEEWTPSYAGGCSRMDFLLKQEQIVVEVKKTRKTLGAKEVGEQLIIDIKKYEAHPDCKRLFCFVYDPEGWIANPRGIENDLNGDDGGLPRRVLITPI
jgi:hypothetical protein